MIAVLTYAVIHYQFYLTPGQCPSSFLVNFETATLALSNQQLGGGHPADFRGLIILLSRSTHKITNNTSTY
jgi:hypothetical protein